MNTAEAKILPLPSGQPRNEPAHGRCEHAVQFYEDEEYLAESVAEFFREGLAGGENILFIGRPEQRGRVEALLRREGIDLEGLCREGRYEALDARETLARFMAGKRPNAVRFRASVGAVLKEKLSQGAGLRAFGEMVAVLHEEGNAAGALRLEELWNALARSYPFRLLCGYSMRGFQGEKNRRFLRQVCDAHTAVLPAESYSRQGAEAVKLRQILELQQQAASLQTEIGERKRAECKEREQQARLGIALEIAKLGVWELDLLTKELTASERCRAQFGFTDEAPILPGTVLRRIHEEDRGRVWRGVKAAIEANSDCALEFRVVLPGAAVRWIAAMGRCFHNGSHRMLGVSKDVTERKVASELLERTVAERTEELRRTVAELEAFSYSISHDLRAPLRSMRSFADILLDETRGTLTADHRALLDRIAGSGERMDRLIQDVLTLTRLSRAELKVETVNLEHLVRGILECYPNLQAPSAGIVIEGKLPLVKGSPAALTQCFSNLLGNAVKFVPPGRKPQVVVRAEQGSQEGRVTVVIADNGIGVPQEAQERIFDMFYRLWDNYEGTGVGLAIVKKAVERMGGSVRVASEEGKGSRFYLELEEG